jgi:hypothetical protein
LWFRLIGDLFQSLTGFAAALISAKKSASVFKGLDAI